MIPLFVPRRSMYSYMTYFGLEVPFYMGTLGPQFDTFVLGPVGLQVWFQTTLCRYSISATVPVRPLAHCAVFGAPFEESNLAEGDGSGLGSATADVDIHLQQQI